MYQCHILLLLLLVLLPATRRVEIETQFGQLPRGNVNLCGAKTFPSTGRTT